jgi:hypothetical protein
MGADAMRNINCTKVTAENSIIKAKSRQMFYLSVSGIAFA